MSRLAVVGVAFAIAAGACSGDDGRPNSEPAPSTTAADPGTTTAAVSPTIPETVAVPDWRWTVGSEAPIVERYQHVAAWTGEELVVWGGAGSEGVVADGAAYDPLSDTWRVLAESPLSPRARASGAWNGEELIVLGGFDDGIYQAEAGAYDPVSDSWRLLAEFDLDATVRVSDLVVNDGDLFLRVIDPLGWHRLDPDTGRTSPVDEDPRLRDPAYDLLAERGFRHPSTAPLIWTGQEIVDVRSEDGFSTQWFAIDPTTNTEAALPAPPDGPTRWDFTSAWTGDSLIVWGGSYCGPNTDCSFDGSAEPLVLTRNPDVTAVAPVQLDEVEGDWILTRMEIQSEAISFSSAPTISLVVEEASRQIGGDLFVGRTVGEAGCPYDGPVNNYGDSGISWNGPLLWTPPPCPTDIAESDQVYRSALTTTDTLSVIETEPRQLWLRGPGVRLTFDRESSIMLKSDGPEEVYVLPGVLPDGFEYVSAAFPSVDSHPNFVGSVTLRDNNESITLSIRWISRSHTGPDAPIDDQPAAGPAVEIAGRTIFAQPSSRNVLVPLADGTTVEVTLDQTFEDTSPELLSAVIGALEPVSGEQWLRVAGSLSSAPIPCTLSDTC